MTPNDGLTDAMRAQCLKSLAEMPKELPKKKAQSDDPRVAFIDIPESDAFVKNKALYRSWLADLVDNIQTEMGRHGWRVRLVHESGAEGLEFLEGKPIPFQDVQHP